MLRPPSRGLSSPLAARAMSRTISPSTRSLGAREQSVGRVLRVEFGCDSGGLAISRRSDDQTMQRLDAPPVVHELAGEPIEQFGMGRRFAAHSKVLRRVHDAVAE